MKGEMTAYKNPERNTRKHPHQDEGLFTLFLLKFGWGLVGMHHNKHRAFFLFSSVCTLYTAFGKFRISRKFFP